MTVIFQQIHSLLLKPGSGWQHPSPVWVAWWCGLANTTRLRWRDEEGEYRSSISKVFSLPKSFPGWDRGLATSYVELGPCQSRKKAKKTLMKMNQLLNKVVFLPFVDTINTGSCICQHRKSACLCYQGKIWCLNRKGRRKGTHYMASCVLECHIQVVYKRKCLSGPSVLTHSSLKELCTYF